MEFENFDAIKASKKNKKKRKSVKREAKLEEEEAEPAPVENASKKTKKKKKFEKENPELEQESESSPVKPVENDIKKKRRRRKPEQKESEQKEDLDPPVENATPKFGRRSKGEVNNNTLSPSKSDKGEVSDSSFALPIESKKKKRKSSEADDTLLPDVDTTMEAEFESPPKKLRIGEKDFMKECENLLSVAAELVKPDSLPYSKTLPSFDYSKLAKHFPDKSPEVLKNELLLLIEGTVKIKCLHQLLNEALIDIQTEKCIVGGFNNFLHTNNEKIMEEARKEGLQSTPMTVATEMWKNLSALEKRAYKGEKKRKGKMIGQNPYEVFYSLLRKKEGKVNQIDARIRFKNLPIEKRVKYIRKSAKQMIKAYEDIKEKRKQEEEDEEDYSSETLEKGVRGPSKEEFDMYLKHHGFPNEPTSHLPSYFCEEKKIHVDGKNLLMSKNRVFYDLSKEKQEQWKLKLKKAKDKFNEEVEEWQDGQDKVTLFIWKRLKASGIKMPKKNEKKVATGRSFKVKEYIRQLTYHDVQVTVAKFDGEPVMPPLDPVKLFGIELEKRRNEKYNASQIKAQYDALDQTKKMTFRKTCEEIKEKFIDGLKDYVGNLSYEQRKLFLGANRIKYIKALHQDIFEEDYPHTEYKVYAKLKKATSPTKASKTKSGKDSQNKEETDEDEEEDDMIDFQRAKSSKLVANLGHYASRKETVKKLKLEEESNDENDNDDDDEEDDNKDDDNDDTEEDNDDDDDDDDNDDSDD